jgi:hypothetical protein
LYHVGDITDSETPKFAWKTDVTDGKGLFSLARELKSKLEILLESLSERRSLLLAGELSAYVAERNPELGTPLVSECTKITQAWVEISEPDCTNSPDQVISYRRSQLFYFLDGISCFHGLSTLSDSQIWELVRFNICARRLLPYAPRPSQVEEFAEFSDLRFINDQVISRHVNEIISEVFYNPQYLTSCVTWVLSRVSEKLRWAPIQNHPGCFEGVAPGGDTFSLNILNGALLRNGHPMHELVCTFYSSFFLPSPSSTHYSTFPHPLSVIHIS